MACRRTLTTLIVLFYLSTVICQNPQIVEDIFPEVKRKSDTGYLNCTVSRQQNNKVNWIQPLGGVNDNWISSDTEILAKNEVVNGKQKYEVIRRVRGNDKITYTLVVNRLREEDSGRYKCTVFLVGKDQREWPYKYGNMTVQVPPTIKVSQTSNTVQRNQASDVTLRCNATGTPNPNITWIRADGKALPDGRLSHRGHFLHITNIRKDDRGIYRCLADNNVIPPAHHDAKLVVNFKPEAEAVQDTVGQAQNRRFHALLECKIKGMPEPNLRWYMITDTGPVSLIDDAKYDINQLLTHGTSLQLNDVWYTLKILNVQANDYTMYYCEGSNALGTSRAEIKLYETNQCQGPDCPTIGALSSAFRLQISCPSFLSVFIYLGVYLYYIRG
ncbi:lachesin-like [Liolophura sinensis]|uniref:lachesin-like n=1 Tax=Liolophura sinensis TaxID=3198878 RepID=UPI0031587CEA